MIIVPPVVPVVPPFVEDELEVERTGSADREAWDAVTDARTRTLDALEGFKKMAEHAEPEFAPIVAAYVELHTRHGEELTRMLVDAGVPPDGDASLMGSVNRVVVATRAMVDDIDADVLKQIHSGERHVMAAYQGALAADLPLEASDRVAGLLAELRELIDDTRPVGQ